MKNFVTCGITRWTVLFRASTTYKVLSIRRFPNMSWNVRTRIAVVLALLLFGVGQGSVLACVGGKVPPPPPPPAGPPPFGSLPPVFVIPPSPGGEVHVATLKAESSAERAETAAYTAESAATNATRA